MYRPGELDQQITINRLTVSDDGYGGETQTATSLGTVWAKVKPMSGKESKDQERVHDVGNYRFIIRRPIFQVLEDDFITWNGGEFNIRMVHDYGNRVLYLEIDVERNAQR